MKKTILSNDIISTLNLINNFDNISIEESEVLKNLKSMIDKKILEQHKYSIYYSESEKRWITYIPDEESKDHRKRIRRTNKENLEKYLIDFYVAKCEQEAHDNISLEDLYTKWLLFRRDNTSAKYKTLYENMNDWNKFYKDTYLAKMRVKDITPKVLSKFFRSITQNRSYTYKRISNARTVLNGIMYYAIEEDIIVHNPVLDVNFKSFTYKPVENQSYNVYSREETIKLLTYLADINEPYALAIQLSFYLFIRIGETKAIRFEDINLEKRTIYLHSQAVTERTLNDDLTFSSRKVSVINQMKGNTSQGFREQELTDEAIKIIHKAMLLNPSGTYLFEPKGKIMTTDRFNRKLEKYCKECGVTYHSSHKIRFYNASTAYDGKNLTTISSLMGHSQVATTLHYLRNVRLDNQTTIAFQKLGLATQNS